MVSPQEVAAAAKRRERENYRFRRYLKSHADGDKLDSQFWQLHQELFASYDCSQCRNCCKQFCTSMTLPEIAAASDKLGMTGDEFAERYLTENMELAAPCPFLLPGGTCQIEDCKPEECRSFPYTDREDRLGSLLSILCFAEVCPVVFEMLEWLKEFYHFR